MHRAIRKNKIIIYAICLFFFFLAGFFQMIDSKLPEFWHALLALLAHVILIALVIFWGVSLIHRIVRKDLRVFLISIAIFILFFLTVRMIKYGLTEETDALSRYMWYSYYVSLCFIPPTLLLATLSIENKYGKPIKSSWYFIYLPAIILLGLIYSNDFHEWAFAFSFHEGDFTYSHRIVFYLALAWEIIVTLISLVLMILKCQVSACKKRTWIPICTFLGCAFISTICFFTNISAFKIPELLCFTCIATIESCINIGLIPSNANYEEYFYHSMCSAVITNENLDVVYSSKTSVYMTKAQLEKALISPLMIDENIRFCSEKINGGYVFRSEDLTLIHEINNTLQETKEQIREENDLIEAEIEIKAQKAKIDEQKKLYARVEEYTRDELKQLDELLKMENIKDKQEFIHKMRYACVLSAYVKRRSNLIMLTRKNDVMDVEELAISIKESLDYLSLTGVECFLEFCIKGKINGNTIGTLYDFFEVCVAHEYNLPSAIMIHVYKKEENVVIRIESDIEEKYFLPVTKRIKEKFGVYSSIENDGQVTYFSLSLPWGGNL